MTFYFCIGDVLNRIERANSAGGGITVLGRISSTPLSCNGHKEDAFILSSTPDTIKLDGDDGLQKLTRLLEDVPLYKINMELALDHALTERHTNATVRTALEKSFSGRALPTTLTPSQQETGDENAGNLHHPMLGHIETLVLCRTYIDFLKALGPDNSLYNFETDIIGRHPESFLEYYDGYTLGNIGAIRADTLLGFSARIDHDPGKQLESYIEGGTKRAIKMKPEEPQERIWAWLESDNYQMRRCMDIHRLLMMPAIKRRPNWVRTDIFILLEREAMKQAFADMIIGSDRTKKLLDQAPLIKKAVQANADGQVDERLQALLSQVLNAGTGYAGAAAKFAQSARDRECEAKKIRFV